MVLVIAGSDPSGGAGLQVDLKVLSDHRVYGAAVVSALTVQNTRGVLSVHPVDARLVHDQIAAVIEDLPIAAVKVGMLGESGVVGAVTQALGALDAGVPVVVDPVSRSTSGRNLLHPGAASALLDGLLPLACLLTPNLEEFKALDASAGGLRGLCQDRGVALLVKGGHRDGEVLVDDLWLPDGSRHRFHHPRVATGNTHGTGCVLSTAIAARLAMGMAVVPAARAAVNYLQRLLLEGAKWRLGSGPGPLPAGLGVDGPNGDGAG